MKHYAIGPMLRAVLMSAGVRDDRLPLIEVAIRSDILRAETEERLSRPPRIPSTATLLRRAARRAETNSRKR